MRRNRLVTPEIITFDGVFEKVSGNVSNYIGNDGICGAAYYGKGHIFIELPECRGVRWGFNAKHCTLEYSNKLYRTQDAFYKAGFAPAPLRRALVVFENDIRFSKGRVFSESCYGIVSRLIRYTDAYRHLLFKSKGKKAWNYYFELAERYNESNLSDHNPEGRQKFCDNVRAFLNVTKLECKVKYRHTKDCIYDKAKQKWQLIDIT